MLVVGIRMGRFGGGVVRTSRALSWGSCWCAEWVFGWTDSMNSSCSLACVVSVPAIFNNTALLDRIT